MLGASGSFQSPLENHFAQSLQSLPRFVEIVDEWGRNHAGKLRYSVQVLGTVSDAPIFLIRPQTLTNKRRVLVSAGFHGEEPAGPWGVIKFLYQGLSMCRDVEVSFLPLVNPTGFSHGTRLNDRGQNPNAGFVTDGSKGAELSVEGEILVKHVDALTDLSADGCLCLHEDWEQLGGYLYAYERGESPSTNAGKMRSVLARHVTLVRDDAVDYAPLENAIAFNHFDGSFEHLLFTRGAAAAYCTETPGLRPAAERIVCNTALIETFVRL